jgi:Plasmid stabilization system protein
MDSDSFAVHMTKMADRDLKETIKYFAGKYEFQAAKDFLDAVESAVSSLEKYPFRNPVPDELKEYPDNSVRETLVFSHRLIYRVVERDVFVLFVPHGKRSIEDELVKRALRLGSLEDGRREDE